MSNLIVRAFAGFIFLMLVLALALFLSAGSLGFWQAWVYLGVFAVCTILITVYLIRYDPNLLAGRVQAGPDVGNPKEPADYSKSGEPLFHWRIHRSRSGLSVSLVHSATHCFVGCRWLCGSGLFCSFPRLSGKHIYQRRNSSGKRAESDFKRTLCFCPTSDVCGGNPFASSRRRWLSGRGWRSRLSCHS